MIGFLLEIPMVAGITGLTDLFIEKPSVALEVNRPDVEFIAWGDPVGGEEFMGRLQEKLSPGDMMNNLYGHYYYLWIKKSSGELVMGNSLFSILPVYYHQRGGKIVISDNVFRLSKYLGVKEVNKRFVLETVLFNYPLFNSSLYEGINLLPSNSYIRLSGQTVSFCRHTETAGLFGKEPLPWKGALKFMPDVFLQSTFKYLPSKHYACALTGGFDSRTLVAAGLMLQKDFATYSFGSHRSKDLLLSAELSRIVGLKHKEILLGDEYITQGSLIDGKDFIINSSGTATFARAHYLYATRKLAAETDCIVTGNFGSEIFRAAHIAGAVISNNLYLLFNARSPEEAFSSIEMSKEYRCLNMATFDREWRQLQEEIISLPCYDPKYSLLSKNQRFYLFVMEEVFRKYFGAEMINQFRHLKNRTPYLDIDFLKEIFRTGLAGIHSGFFEHNPLKRFKGQVLYSHIIRRSYPELGRLITDKGYLPDDLLTLAGKIRVAVGYFHKKTGKMAADPDPNNVSLSWESNRDYWMYLPLPDEYFMLPAGNPEEISKEILFRICSLSYCINY
mgnify:CR=1 FL=1